MLGPGLPLLRKDFLFDPLQVIATAAFAGPGPAPDRPLLDSAEALAAMIGRAWPWGRSRSRRSSARRTLALARQLLRSRIIQVNNAATWTPWAT